MPEKETLDRARKDRRQGKAPSTQAGEFVREEIHHTREGKHGARSTKQAIAIGLSKARRAGVNLKPPRKGSTSTKTRQTAERDYEHGQSSSTEGHLQSVPKRRGELYSENQRVPHRARPCRTRLAPARAAELPSVVQRLPAKLHVHEQSAKTLTTLIEEKGDEEF